MPNQNDNLPKEGDQAPQFEALTQRGLVSFPEYSRGHWCIIFAHPANFTSAWMMFNTFMVLKERWFNERNTKLIGLCSEPVRRDDWSDRVRRYIDIYLKAPLIEDPEFKIAKLFGLSAGRRINPESDRVAFIIDPEGVIRLIIKRPVASIEFAIRKLEMELNRLQGKILSTDLPDTSVMHTTEGGQVDCTPIEQLQPAYFDRDTINPN